MLILHMNRRLVYLLGMGILAGCPIPSQKQTNKENSAGMKKNKKHGMQSNTGYTKSGTGCHIRSTISGKKKTGGGVFDYNKQGKVYNKSYKQSRIAVKNVRMVNPMSGEGQVKKKSSGIPRRKRKIPAWLRK
ncbi:hypothetical protein L218DRAFT_700594 [Marasmius fiardii PR-910]|nr:hypothetical protein L218DRAFT_700594 [Marasmius fiardii PR-910]